MEIIAKRQSISFIEILNDQRQKIASILFPNGIWSCENSVVGDPFEIDKKLGTYPVIEIGEAKFAARKRLLTDRFLANQFEISFWNDRNQEVISAFVPSWIWQKSQITFQGKKYELAKNSPFIYRFRLEDEGNQVIRFKEVTPFFNASVKRSYSMQLKESIDPVLLTFSFFLTL